MPDVTPLAARITAKQRTYERLAAEYWEHFDVFTAVRYRAMALAYRVVVEEDLTWYAQSDSEPEAGEPA
jgi:hypothetical protein